MLRRFQTVDVFTSVAFSGNPLAVVLDAEGLTTAQMQAVAREFNYVETSFVLPPRDPAHAAHVRIFTPDRELPFAGHPNVGTAFVLARLGEAFGRPVGDEIMFEEGAGLVPVTVLREDGEVAGGELTAPQPFRRGPEAEPSHVAAAVSLDVEDIATSRHAPVVASVGLPFLVAELGSRDALRRVVPDPMALAHVLRLAGVSGLYLYTRDVAKGDASDTRCDLSARMVCRIPLVVEDPATGSATCALVALLAHLAPDQDLVVATTIAQGVDMGRPSLLEAHVRKCGGSVEAVRVGGRCIEVMHGTLHLPNGI